MEIGFFGKIPEFEDFIRSDSMSEESTAFRRWFDSSFASMANCLGDELASKYPSLGTISSVVRPGDCSHAFLSIATPSADASGRHSPFVVFAEVRSLPSSDDLKLIIPTYWRFHQVALKCSLQPHCSFGFQQRRNTLWNLEAGLSDGFFNSRAQVRSFLENTSLLEFSRLISSDGSSETGRRTIESALLSLVPSRNTNKASFKAILRFPVPSSREKAPLAMVFWQLLTEGALGLKIGWSPVFWSDQHLDIAFRHADEDILPIVWLPDRDDDQLWVFDQMLVTEEMVQKPLYDRTQAVLEDSESSLSILLKNLSELMKG